MKKILLLFLAAVLTGCGIYLAFYIYGGYREDKEVKDSMKSVELLQSQAVVSKEDTGGGQEPDEPDGNISSINPGISVDFGVLSDTNPDIMAWLHIPDTYISFPVLQERTLMEYYYLDHDHTGQHNTAGAIFTPAEPPGTDDMHLLLFGHNSKYNDVMFGGLYELYGTYEEGMKHEYAYLVYPDHTEQWELWCAVMSNADDGIYEVPYQSGTDSYAKLLADIEDKSLYTDGEIPGSEDRILVLSTCNGAAGGTKRFYTVFRYVGGDDTR